MGQNSTGDLTVASENLAQTNFNKVTSLATRILTTLSEGLATKFPTSIPISDGKLGMQIARFFDRRTHF